MSDNFLLELSTAAIDPERFTVDGESYDLLGINHLSDKDEIAVTAMFSRYDRLSKALEEAPNQRKAEDVARVMRQKRLELLGRMTTCPVDVLGKLPLKSQIALMEAIGEEMDDKESGDGDSD